MHDHDPQGCSRSLSGNPAEQRLVEALAARFDMNRAIRPIFCDQAELERRRAATIRIMRQAAEREARQPS